MLLYLRGECQYKGHMHLVSRKHKDVSVEVWMLKYICRIHVGREGERERREGVFVCIHV